MIIGTVLILQTATDQEPPEGAQVAAPAIRFADVTLAYGEDLALRVDHVEVPAGTVAAVIGPNGSGKSTFLGAVSGLIAPASGQVSVLGSPPGRNRARVAHVLQETPTSGQVPLTVLEVVRMGRYAVRGAFGRFTDEDHAAVDAAVRKMGLEHVTDRHLTELSGGQRQRVYVAQGLAQGADLLLLDEPATGLDLPSQDRIREVVEEQRSRGRTVVYTTHDVAEAALADEVVLLAGRVVAAGEADQVLTPELLGEAYGGRIHVTDEGTLLLDDPHHLHPHESHAYAGEEDGGRAPTERMP